MKRILEYSEYLKEDWRHPTETIINYKNLELFEKSLDKLIVYHGTTDYDWRKKRKGISNTYVTTDIILAKHYVQTRIYDWKHPVLNEPKKDVKGLIMTLHIKDIIPLIKTKKLALVADSIYVDDNDYNIKHWIAFILRGDLESFRILFKPYNI